MSLFVTGTDTGAGKTVVTAALAGVLRGRGLRVGVMKPAETGCQRREGRLIREDTEILLRASGCIAPLDMVNPYALEEPLAPALAAERAGVYIDLDHIAHCFRWLQGEHDVVLVEGAGGLLVPLSGDATMLDLARLLGLRVLVVARNVLGAINHTALTVRAARAEGLDVVGVVLNHTGPGTDTATETNGEALRRWGGAPLLGQLPYMQPLQADTLEARGNLLDLDRILPLLLQR